MATNTSRTGSEDSRLTVSIPVFALNMTKSNMITVLQRECGPVLDLRFSSPHPKQGLCIVTFEKEGDAEKAMALGKQRSPVYHADLGVFWRKGLEVFRGNSSVLDTGYEGRRRRGVSHASSPPSFSPTAEHARCAEAFLASLPVETAASQPPKAEVPPAAPVSLPEPSESSPSSNKCMTAELRTYRRKHEKDVVAHGLLRLRIEDVHRRVKSIHVSLDCHNKMAAATAERITQTRVKIDGLKTSIETAEEERATLARLREEDQQEIEKISQLEAQVRETRARNAALEGLLSNIAQRIEAEEHTRADQALRIEIEVDLNEISPLVKKTFLSDTMLTAFWRIHDLVNESVEEVRAERSWANRNDSAEVKALKKQKLDTSARATIPYRLPNA